MVTSCTNTHSPDSDERLYSSFIEEVWRSPQTNSYMIIFLNTSEDPQVFVLTPQEIIFWLRKEGLPISIIADIMKVERKSVYAWMKGTLLRSPNQARLEKLYSLISNNKQAELIHLYRFWNRKLPNGLSLGELLKEENLNDEAIKKALIELWPLAIKAKKITRANRHNKKSPFLEEIGEIIITNDF